MHHDVLRSPFAILFNCEVEQDGKAINCGGFFLAAKQLGTIAFQCVESGRQYNIACPDEWAEGKTGIFIRELKLKCK